MQLRCTHCDAAFEGESDARCPKCLRRTSVVEAIGAPDHVERRADAPAPWPAGTACPLCLSASVGDDVFHLETAKVATVRCRCCPACRARVRGLQRLRRGALPFVFVGMLAWPCACVAEAPLRAWWHLDFTTACAIGTLVSLVVAGVPLVLVDRANRAMRKDLEMSWLFSKVQARLSPPSGLIPQEQWNVLADVSPESKVVGAEELIRS